MMPRKPIRQNEQPTSQTRHADQMAAPARKMAETMPAPKRSGGKVTIGCKLPIPWLDLEISELVLKDIPGTGGITQRKEAVKTGEFIRVRGTAYPRAGGIPDGFPGKPIMMNGVALTPNVDEDKWRNWLEHSGGKMMDVVKNGLLFAYTDLASVKDHAKEIRDVQTGLEPLDPRTDPDTGKSMDARAPKKVLLGVNEVGKENEAADTETRLYEMMEKQEAAVAGRE